MLRPTVSSLVVETFVDAPEEATLTSRPAVTTSSGASMSTVSAVIRLGSAYRCSTASSLRASAEPKWKVSNNAMKHRTIFSASPERSHRHPHYRADNGGYLKSISDKPWSWGVFAWETCR